MAVSPQGGWAALILQLRRRDSPCNKRATNGQISLFVWEIARA